MFPQLFNIYVEHIIRETLVHGTGGISIGERRSSNLRYEDDTTLIASDEEEMAELVNLVKISKRFGLRTNALKMKVMVMERAKGLLVSTALSDYKKVQRFCIFGLHNRSIWRPFSQNTVPNRSKQISYH